MSKYSRGVLKNWNRDRAFGFISATDAYGIRFDAFVHVSNIVAGKPVIGCECQFVAGAAPKGATALQVTFFTLQEPDASVSEPVFIEPQTLRELRSKENAIPVCDVLAGLR